MKFSFDPETPTPTRTEVVFKVEVSPPPLNPKLKVRNLQFQPRNLNVDLWGQNFMFNLDPEIQNYPTLGAKFKVSFQPVNLILNFGSNV